MTQKDKIYGFLKLNPQWFKSYALQGMAQDFGASPSTVDRRLRDLYKEGSVERRRVGKYEEYRIKQVQPVYAPAPIKENIRLFEFPINQDLRR